MNFCFSFGCGVSNQSVVWEKYPTIVITAADSSSSSLTTSTEVETTNKESKVDKDESEYALKENLNKEKT